MADSFVYTSTVPKSQTGIANGTLALLLVFGSLFGFFYFHLLPQKNVQDMYKMYIIISIATSALTCLFVFEREDELKKQSVYNLHDHEFITNDDDHEKKEQEELDNEFSILLHEEQQQLPSKQISKQQNENNVPDKYKEHMPPLHTLIRILIYEPVMNKTRSEIISVYWIDTSQHYDFFIVTISRFFYYMGISSQTFFLYFIHDMLKHTTQTENPEAVVALIAIIGQCSGAFTCLPVGILSDQYFHGRRKPFVYTAW